MTKAQKCPSHRRDEIIKINIPSSMTDSKIQKNKSSMTKLLKKSDKLCL